MAEDPAEKPSGKAWSKVKAAAVHPASIVGVPLASVLLNHALQTRARKKERKLRERERADQAERIEELLKKHKNLRASIQLSSGGNSGINRKIAKLQKLYKWMKRLDTDKIYKDGKTYHKQTVAKEIGQLRKRFDLHRDQRMALEAGDVEKVIELVNPMVNDKIELAVGRRVIDQAVKRAGDKGKEIAEDVADKAKGEARRRLAKWEKAQNKKIVIWGGIPPALGIATTVGGTAYAVNKSNESERRINRKLDKLKKKKVELSELYELFEFAMPKSYDGVLKVYQKIHDQIKKIGYPAPTSHPKTYKKLLARKDMLEQWKRQVGRRLDGIEKGYFYDSSFRRQGIKIKSKPKDANTPKKKAFKDMTTKEKARLVANTPPHQRKSFYRIAGEGRRGSRALAQYHRELDESKVSSISNKIHHVPDDKILEHRIRNKRALMKRLGWGSPEWPTLKKMRAREDAEGWTKDIRDSIARENRKYGRGEREYRRRHPRRIDDSLFLPRVHSPGT